MHLIVYINELHINCGFLVDFFGICGIIKLHFIFKEMILWLLARNLKRLLSIEV